MTPFDLNPGIHNDFASRRTNVAGDGSRYISMQESFARTTRWFVPTMLVLSVSAYLASLVIGR